MFWTTFPFAGTTRIRRKGRAARPSAPGRSPSCGKITQYSYRGTIIGANVPTAPSSLSPLRDDDGVFGSLTLASEDPQAFGTDEVAVLTQLANNIAYGLTALRNREALRLAEERSRAHASRLEVLWRIATNPALTGDELTLAMLAETTSAIRPGFPFMGALFRISGDDVVVEAVCETPEVRGDGPWYRRPPGRTAHSRRRHSRRTRPRTRLRNAHMGRSASNVRYASRATHWLARHHRHDVRIGTRDVPLVVRRTRAHTELGDRGPGLRRDCSVVFSSQAQMRWQFSQLQYHQTHDVLTGLYNRSQFRSQARIATIGSAGLAIVVLDMNAFSDVNKAYGNMIGDALLVEVAAGLSENALPGEIVGRLYGETFAVCIPDPRSHEFVRERALHFAQRFQRPFSTGDREGKEFVTLTACVGTATAPEHRGDPRRSHHARRHCSCCRQSPGARFGAGLRPEHGR